MTATIPADDMTISRTPTPMTPIGNLYNLEKYLIKMAFRKEEIEYRKHRLKIYILYISISISVFTSQAHGKYNLRGFTYS
jgi:hypothetical protein